jgi:subtilase family serine protease
MLRHGHLPNGAPLIPRARKPIAHSQAPGGPRTSRPQLEELEPRNLPSLAGALASPMLDAVPAPDPSATTITPQDGGGYAVYTPAQIRAAYGFNNVSQTGAGQTIAIVGAFDDPYILGELTTFDHYMGLPGQSVSAVSQFFKKVNEYGQSSNFGQVNDTWAVEIALDVEWAHAIAPGANILLVEANSNSGNDLLTAINTARNTPGVSVVSMSWGETEFAAEVYFNSFFTTPAGHIGGNNQPGGVTFVAATGDNGAWSGPDWPAVMPNVLAVGGSTLSVSGTTYQGETAWSGGGGGISKYIARPSYQATATSSSMRTTPDVSYDANPNTGYYIYSSFNPWGGSAGWMAVGGTSAGTPQWAGLIALADQARAQVGRPSLDGAQAGLYSLPSSDFHDIVSGSNGNPAKVGYDAATGLGTPYADRIINGLLLVPGDPGYTASSNTVKHLPGSSPHLNEATGASSQGPQGSAALLANVVSTLLHQTDQQGDDTNPPQWIDAPTTGSKPSGLVQEVSGPGFGTKLAGLGWWARLGQAVEEETEEGWSLDE